MKKKKGDCSATEDDQEFEFDESLKKVLGLRFNEQSVMYDEDNENMHQNSKFLISLCIPDFVPSKNFESSILDEIGIKMLTLHLPSRVRMREWDKLFTIESDGTSMLTFYESLRERDDTIILIQDSQDSVFGCFAVEEWHKSIHFYGSGESFVFNFDISKEETS